MNFSFFKKLSPKKRGATIIIGLGLSVLLIVFAVGVGSVVRNTTGSIKAFKNQWQARLMTESAKEKLLLRAQNQEAGFSLNEDDCAKEANTTNPNNPGSTVAANDVVKCTVEGRNLEPVYTVSPTTPPWFTVPNANTGDAGLDCSPMRKFTTVDMLQDYYNTATAVAGEGDQATTQAATSLFEDNPLNHPCNWGKLNFGNNFTSRVVVPLYYDSGEEDANKKPIIINPNVPRQVGEETALKTLTDLKIRVRTPCKPIAERTTCIPPSGSTARISTPECLYEDICKNMDRYQFEPGNRTIDQDKTIVVWQISGECTIADNPSLKESCALTPNDSKQRNNPKKRLTGENSEIYESFLNNFLTDSLKIISQDSQGKTAYYYYDPNNPPPPHTILDFLTLTPSNYIQADPDTKYTFIDKPLLQLAISSNELFDNSPTPKRIPYLEYQIVTNVPVSNITQQFKTEINYGGQAFQQSYSIEQKKNVVDFALQD
jgi:hypothetical protein